MLERDMGKELPTIVATAPCRISLFGGGTDVSPYWELYGGRVMNFAVNIYNEVTVSPASSNQLITRGLEKYGFTQGNVNLSIKSAARGGGLGSSGSLTVALLGALREYRGDTLDKHQVAIDAYNLEVKDLGWHGGCQDQFASAYGGFNIMEIGEQIEISPQPREWITPFLDWLVLVDTGLRHRSASIQAGFLELTKEKVAALDSLKVYVGVAKRMFEIGDYAGLGGLLDDNWKKKKASSPKSTTPELDDIYNFGKDRGAIGAKVLGAGGGGHFLFVVPPLQREYLVQQLTDKGLKERQFLIDYNGLQCAPLFSVQGLEQG